MNKIVALSLTASMLLLSALNANQAQDDIELQFVNKVIPGTKISKYAPAEVQGFYKVFMENGNIIYVNPVNELVLLGEIWTSKGFSITANDKQAWQQELNKGLLKQITDTYNTEELLAPSKKVVYGKGSTKYEFVLFTDPECPYCKQVEAFLETKDTTVHFVLTPLSFHQNAEEWSLKALSSKNFKEAIGGIKDGKIPDVAITKEAKEALAKMKKLGETLKVDGTPALFVLDKTSNSIVDVINGANIPAITKFIEDK
ncbi:MAG: DsbC family protein [Sulfurimonadaceae bacterium]|jgi:thiol:disulfide interchange protein DsbC|nr:DsbC family protein [Sulfurimonadaceae bacterium]